MKPEDELCVLSWGGPEDQEVQEGQQVLEDQEDQVALTEKKTPWLSPKFYTSV